MEGAWKRNEVAVSPVIATILLVAITVVLAAVLYVMLTGLFDTNGGEGHVQMTKEPIDPFTWEIRIAAASPTDDLGGYMVVILKNDSRIHIMDPLEEVTTGDYRFTDLDGRGTLSAGDRFIVTCDPNSRYELAVIWRDSDNQRGSVDWET